MYVVMGILTGVLGFLPLILSARLSRRSPSEHALTTGLYGLGGVAISLVILVVGLLICAKLARDGLVSFVVAEAVVFLGCTIVYVLYKNRLDKRRRDERS
jgi:Ca2+/Na+ antiporter